MSQIRPKRPRLRLEPEAYQRLLQEVLARDNWRCQHCGARHSLQVHHQAFRSRSGDDAEQNLITLCQECHARAHMREPLGSDPGETI